MFCRIAAGELAATMSRPTNSHVAAQHQHQRDKLPQADQSQESDQLKETNQDP